MSSGPSSNLPPHRSVSGPGTLTPWRVAWDACTAEPKPLWGPGRSGRGGGEGKGLWPEHGGSARLCHGHSLYLLAMNYVHDAARHKYAAHAYWRLACRASPSPVRSGNGVGGGNGAPPAVLPCPAEALSGDAVVGCGSGVKRFGLPQGCMHASRFWDSHSLAAWCPAPPPERRELLGLSFFYPWCCTLPLFLSANHGCRASSHAHVHVLYVLYVVPQCEHCQKEHGGCDGRQPAFQAREGRALALGRASPLP